MKNLPYLFLPAALLISLSAVAQFTPDKFGTVKTEDMAMTSYAADAEAEAVVLYDIGNTYFYNADDGFRIIFERKTKIKILKKAGLDYASVEIPFYFENTKMENVFDIEGYTFNLDNGAIRTSRLNNKTTFEEKINEHWMVKKFAMPDVKEGSVIEYSYKVMSPYFFNLHDWEFQNRIPTIYSEYTVRMIPFYEYCYIFQGAKKFDVFKNSQSSLKQNFAGTEYPDNIFTFGMKNIPAFRDEQYITSINDYIMKIDFQLAVLHHLNGAKVDVVTTWPLLIESMLKQSEFGLYLKAANRNAEDMIPSLALDPKTANEKAEAITDYVKLNYNWNGYNTKYTSQSVKDFLKLKTGNSADINLFLCSLLNAAGLKAYPVLLSTRDHGKISLDFPFQHFLNYVIVLVDIDGKIYLLDATEPLSPFGMLPARCINDKGLIVNKEKVEWVILKDDAKASESDSVFIAINETLDSATIGVHVYTEGHKALEYRRSYITDPDNFKKQCFGDDMDSKRPVTVKNDLEIEKPFIVQFETCMPVEKVGDRILITPFPSLTPTVNPLKVGFRNYPVDMVYAKTNILNTVLEIPKGYKFAEGQKNMSVDNALVSISYTTENISNKIFVKGSYTFKKAVYLQHEYYSLKEYFSDIVNIFNNKIVLIRDTE